MRDSLPVGLPRRLYTYSNERFPVVSHGIGIFIFFMSAYLAAQALTNSWVGLGWDGAAGFVTLLLVFFHLRVMDEFKDAREDAQYRPELPVPRGLVTLDELRLLGIVAIVAQLGLNLWLGLPTFVAYALVLLFTTLMYREFFIGHWLRKDLLLYGISHMVIVPLLASYVYVLYAVRNDAGFHPGFGLYLVMSFIVVFLLEMARKIYSPHQEREGVDSYSKYFGTERVTYVATGLAFLGTLCCTGLGMVLGFTVYYYVGVWVLFAIVAGGFLRFRLSPTPKFASHLKTIYAPVYTSGVYLFMILEIGVDHWI